MKDSYFNHPVFDDGELVTFGSRFLDFNGCSYKVEQINFFEDGSFLVGDYDGHVALEIDGKIRRDPHEEDYHKRWGDNLD